MDPIITKNEDGTVTITTVIPETTQEDIVNPKDLQKQIDDLNSQIASVQQEAEDEATGYAAKVKSLQDQINAIQVQLDQILAVVPDVLNQI